MQMTKPTRRMPMLRAASLSLVLMVTLVAGTAQASHYAIADVPRLLTGAQIDKLHKANVNTTEELLDKAAKSKDRKSLAKTTGLSTTELLALARRCDVLRIKGVGSEMVLLLEAAGVRSTVELAKQDATALMTAMNNANKTAKITEKPPTEPQVADWIDQAKKLPPVLEAK
jgi:predicted flap endonuclease-1-like 5' DNA nuclease